jgi:hypothetical protein
MSDEKNQELEASAIGVYPNAFCFRCKSKMTTVRQHTVVLSNKRKAMRGSCANCGGEVYRLLGKSDHRKLTKTLLRAIRPQQTGKSLSRPTLPKLPPVPVPPSRLAAIELPMQNRPTTKRSNSSGRPEERIRKRKLPQTPKASASNGFWSRQATLTEVVLISTILLLASMVFVMANAYLITK